MDDQPPNLEMLERSLQRHQDHGKRTWWSNYVKGSDFYGVPMSTTRSVALDWWRSADHVRPVDEALALGHHPITEVKLSGIAILQHVLLPEGILSASDLPRLRKAMNQGAFGDWNTCDWFCVKVLHQLMNLAPASTHTEMLSWSSDDVIWTKRAALVAFVYLLPKAEPSLGFDAAFLAAAGYVARDQRRFCQTSIGWTMRELSVRAPSTVENFLWTHMNLLTRESITNASRKLEPHTRSELLAAHKDL